MGTLAVRALKLVILLVLAGLVAIQVMMLPAMAADIPADAPDVLRMRWPFLVTCIAGVATLQVALVCIWRLLTMVRHDTVFSTAAFRYVDVVIGAALAASALGVGLCFMLAPGETVPPGMVLLIFIGAVGGLGIALLVTVLRVLLAKAVALDATATTLRAELDEVI